MAPVFREYGLKATDAGCGVQIGHLFPSQISLLHKGDIGKRSLYLAVIGLQFSLQGFVGNQHKSALNLSMAIDRIAVRSIYFKIPTMLGVNEL
jgi:hypothetical protein